jgi:aldehyde:ferredoxin oxidoreductase
MEPFEPDSVIIHPMVLDRKIAFIDLTSGSIETKPIFLDLRRKFLGGRGINMYLQCKEMKCLAGEEDTGVLEKKKFFWKGTRAERCSFNALTVLGGEAYHCDLCGGNPQCVKVCTPKAVNLTK